MTSQSSLQPQKIPNIQHIVLVGSGKGGVGKSTVALNLATYLGLKHRVGLLDADIYGPSLSHIMGAPSHKAEVSNEQKILPLPKHGIRCMSMGFLVEEAESIIWRGPMLFKAIGQFFHDVLWKELDYLIVDLPPGTGDVPLTIAQKVQVSGAITVSTPQNTALIDAKRAFHMWKQLGLLHLGVIENMSGIEAKFFKELESTPSLSLDLFPKGEIDSYLKQHDINKLGVLSFHPFVGLCGEQGMPFVLAHPKHSVTKEFEKVADYVIQALPCV